MNNPFLKVIGPGIQAILLISLSLVMATVGSSLGLYLAASSHGVSMDEMTTLLSNPTGDLSNALRWMNSLVQVLTFLAPALIIAFLFGREKLNGFLLQHPGVFLFSGVVYLFVSEGWVAILSQFNTMLIPSGSYIESIAKPMEDNAAKLMDVILTTYSIPETLIALMTVAVVPAICEEFFFRGALQPLLAKRFKNVHIAVWGTAALFSLYHFQFYGFLPRLLLGALLGYLVVWSGSLWTSMFAHLANNLLAALVYMNYKSAEVSEETGDEWITYALSFLLFGLMTYYLQRLSVWPRLRAAYLGVEDTYVPQDSHDGEEDNYGR